MNAPTTYAEHIAEARRTAVRYLEEANDMHWLPRLVLRRAALGLWTEAEQAERRMRDAVNEAVERWLQDPR